MFSLEEKVRWFAVCSRLLLLALQLLFNLLLPGHAAGVFVKPQDSLQPSTLDHLVAWLFGGLVNWDAQYFLHIAEYGYTYENTLAFFPLFPISVRHISQLVRFLLDVFGVSQLISMHSTLVVVAICFNNILFVKTSQVLYKLSALVLKSDKLAYVSAILFCVNPASIFFSAAYSECLFCYLALQGLLHLELRRSLLSSIILGLGCLTRSNGLLAAGFVLYSHLKASIHSSFSLLFNLVCSCNLLFTFLPFVMYQFYCFAKFCLEGSTAASLPSYIITYALDHDLKLPGQGGSWCNTTFPLPYSYVQNHYWNVGFLKYYQWKQIPNFLLAAPVVFVVFRGTHSFVSHHGWAVLSLGFRPGRPGKALPLSLFPYVLHCVLLTLFSLLMVHVQVTTRMLFSSCPVLYWFIAQEIVEVSKETVGSSLMKNKRIEGDLETLANLKSRIKTFLVTCTFSGYPLFIKIYFFSYFLVGCVMFSNHLPWT